MKTVIIWGLICIFSSLVSAHNRLDLTPQTLPQRNWDLSRKTTLFESKDQSGFWMPNFGMNTGFVDVSVGVHFWHKSLILG